MQDGKPKKGYRYIQTPHGSLVAVYEYVEHVVGVDKKVESRSFKMGLAYCSKNDQFNKERGRMIAQGRLDRQRVYGYVESVCIPVGEFAFPSDAVDAMLSEIRVNTGRMDRGPGWLPKALAHFYAKQEKAAWVA